VDKKIPVILLQRSYITIYPFHLKTKLYIKHLHF